MNKQELVNYLNEYLEIFEYKDSSKNGLQVDNSKQEVKKIWFAVDASTYIFNLAKHHDIDMLITHHWIFWWHEETLTGVSYKRAKSLFDNDIALYTAHIPLDAHGEVGNNYWLAKAFVNIFGLRKEDYTLETFSPYHGTDIGYVVRFKKPLHVSNMVLPYAEQMQLIKKFYNFWNLQEFTSVWFVSGGAGKYFIDAKNAGIDVYVTGEANHWNMIAAKEHEQSILLGGHYETEKIGVKLLAHHLEQKFGLETVFIDEKY